jgi:DNA (cytosine-5)-methyltransferase 1
MFEESQFLGSHLYEDPEDIQARIGYTNPPTHGSRFSGVGGFYLGFHRAGFKNLDAVEQNEESASTFRRNLIEGDQLRPDAPQVLMEREIPHWTGTSAVDPISSGTTRRVSRRRRPTDAAIVQ